MVVVFGQADLGGHVPSLRKQHTTLYVVNNKHLELCPDMQQLRARWKVLQKSRCQKEARLHILHKMQFPDSLWDNLKDSMLVLGNISKECIAVVRSAIFNRNHS